MSRTRRTLALTVATFALLAVTAGGALAEPSATARSGDLQGPPAGELVLVDQNGNEIPISVPDVSTQRRGGSMSTSSEGSGLLSDLGDAAVLAAELPAELEALADAGTLLEPSPGGGMMTPQAVIGDDGRYRITATSSSPYVQMPLITMTRPNDDGSLGGYLCTGWLFGNRTLATAAHCLSAGNGFDATEIKVWFGLDGNTAVAQCGVNVTAAPTQYLNGADSRFDWAIMVLNCNAGNVFGHLGYQALSAAPSEASWAVTGYPGDKYDATVGYTMWSHQGSVSVASDYFWGYNIDTNHGQSGAPLWRLNTGTACGNCAIGVHTYAPSSGYTTNRANRITAAVAQAFSTYSTTYP